MLRELLFLLQFHLKLLKKKDGIGIVAAPCQVAVACQAIRCAWALLGFPHLTTRSGVRWCSALSEGGVPAQRGRSLDQANVWSEEGLHLRPGGSDL